jgi:hypothetical protein
MAIDPMGLMVCGFICGFDLIIEWIGNKKM